MAKVKAHQLRKKPREELDKQLDDLRRELTQLHVTKATGSAPNKLARIRKFRQGVARVMTVISQNRLSELRTQYKGKKFKPLRLRPKRTRALRRRLTPVQISRKTLKARKKSENRPRRKYALIQ